MLRLSLRLVRAGAAGIGLGFFIVTGFAFWAVSTASAQSLTDDIIIEEPVQE
ncbi:MAG: hypothetical protein ACR2O4_18575 [Hyphomicrobiaceae bacterium]